MTQPTFNFLDLLEYIATIEIKPIEQAVAEAVQRERHKYNNARRNIERAYREKC